MNREPEIFPALGRNYLHSDIVAEIDIVLVAPSNDEAEMVRDAMMMSRLNFKLSMVSTETGLLKALDRAIPDIVLSFYELPEISGLEVLQIVQDKSKETAIVIFTDEHEEEQASEVIRNGAWDFLSLKSIQRLESIVLRCQMESRERASKLAYQKALEDAQKRMDLAVHGANLGVWEWDLGTGDFLINESLAHTLGYTEDGMKAQMFVKTNVITFWENYAHPADVERIMKRLKDHFRGKAEEFMSNHRMLTSNGEWKWVLDRGKIFEWDVEGRPLRMVGVQIDVHKQRETEDALIESNRRYVSLIRNLPGVVYRMRHQDGNKIDFISESCSSIFSIGSYELMDPNKEPHNWLHLMNDHDRETRKETILKALVKHKAYEITYRMVVPGSGERWVKENGQGVYDFLTPVAIEGFINDITEQKKNEDQIISVILETEDKERRRLAKELHDGLGQNLTSALLNLNWVKRESTELVGKVGDKFDLGLHFINYAIDETRALARNLMPKSIDDFGYVATIESILEGIEDTVDTHFEFFHNLKERLEPNLELTLFRITQEGINNILKHAEAKNVTIQLMNYDDLLILTIEDNGKGYDPLKLESVFGLTSMESRAQSVGGQITQDSAPGRGTTITLEIQKLSV